MNIIIVFLQLFRFSDNAQDTFILSENNDETYLQNLRDNYQPLPLEKEESENELSSFFEYTHYENTKKRKLSKALNHASSCLEEKKLKSKTYCKKTGNTKKENTIESIIELPKIIILDDREISERNKKKVDELNDFIQRYNDDIVSVENGLKDFINLLKHLLDDITNKRKLNTKQAKISIINNETRIKYYTYVTHYNEFRTVLKEAPEEISKYVSATIRYNNVKYIQNLYSECKKSIITWNSKIE